MYDKGLLFFFKQLLGLALPMEAQQNKCLKPETSCLSLQKWQSQAPAGLSCHYAAAYLCGRVILRSHTGKSKREFVTSQAACQSILVGVCIELSQFEGFLLDAILATGTQMKLAPSPHFLFSSAPTSQPSLVIASCWDPENDKVVFSGCRVGARTTKESGFIFSRLSMFS